MPNRPKPGRRMVDTIAMVYDPDGTLTPLPMQEYTILPKLGIPGKKFWSEALPVLELEISEEVRGGGAA